MSKIAKTTWHPIQFYCENCKMLITANLSKGGSVRIKCSRCGVTYRKQIISETYSVTESFAPYGQTLLCVNKERILS